MPDPRPATSRGASRSAFAGVVLVVLGLGLWVLYRVTAGTEAHAYAPGAVAPTSVQLTAGHTYRLAIPGGVDAAASAGIDPSTLRCTVTDAGGGVRQLQVTPEQKDSKATDTIASFVASDTGRAHIDCAGLPPVFVDDSDDASFDLSGLWLVLASLSLAVGIPLALSALRRPRVLREDTAPAPAGGPSGGGPSGGGPSGGGPSGGGPREDDEVQ